MNDQGSSAASISRGVIVRRVELEGLRRADRIVQNAEAQRHAIEQNAEAERSAMAEEARQSVLREAAQAATRVIAEAEEEARKKLIDLEPQLAELVAETVRAIIGEMETEEASYRAALTALRRMREHKMGRIYCDSETAPAIRRAVSELPDGSADIEGVVIDDTMRPGEVVVSSDRGHAEIGVQAQLDKALKAWEPDDD